VRCGAPSGRPAPAGKYAEPPAVVINVSAKRFLLDAHCPVR
jgi:hypothetical protein